MAETQFERECEERADCQERQRIHGVGGNDDVVDHEHVERQDKAHDVDCRRIADNASNRSSQLLEQMADETSERSCRLERPRLCRP